MTFVAPVSNQFLFTKPKNARIESVRVHGRRPAFRAPKSQLAALVKDSFFADRTLYKYAPLEKGHIRLIVIRRGKLNDPIDCDLHAVDLSAGPYYEALSYEWGEGQPTRFIKLHDFTTDLASAPSKDSGRSRVREAVLRSVGVKFYVRENLYQALRHLRKENEEVTLWNDAICINQAHGDEKEGQIAMMDEIYNSAGQVSIWLGDASANSDEAMEFVKEVVLFENHQAMFQQDGWVQKWDALLELMHSRWFSRRWVIQELVFARDAVVFCGNKMVHWQDLSDAISIFNEKLAAIEAGFRDTSRVFKLHKKDLGIVEAMGASVIVRQLAQILTKDDIGNVVEKRLELDQLVSTLVSFDVGDPRDAIYAILSIARGDPRTVLHPSQKKTLLEVFTEFMKYCVERTGSIDMICRSWAPSKTTLPSNKPLERLLSRKTRLPSWIRQLDDHAFGTPERIFRGRKNADSLVGDPRSLNYTASGKLKAEAIFGTRPVTGASRSGSLGLSNTETYDGSLTVRGIVLGMVTEVSPRIISGIIPQEALKMGDWGHSLEEGDLAIKEVPDKLWRTLVAGRESGSQPPPGWYKRACLYSLQLEDNSGDIHTRDLIDATDSPEQMVKYLKRVQSVVWNRTVFKGNNALFGLAPRQAKYGDIVCILYGCSVPVMLRETTVERDPRTDTPEPSSPVPNPGLNLSLPVRPTHTRKNSYSNIEAHVLKRTPGGETNGKLPHQDSWNVIESKSDTQKEPVIQDFGSHQAESDVIPRSTSPAPTRAENGTTKPSIQHHTKVPISLALPTSYEVVGECYVDGYMDGEALDASVKKAELSFRLV